MGVLFFGDNITLPSVLWMRRMLAGLGDDVATFATEVDPAAAAAGGFEVIVVRDSAWKRFWRLLCRLRLIETVPKTGHAIDTLLRAVQSPRVSVVLMHYLTDAVKYDRVWRRTAKPVVVHCHGYDVTWDYRLAHEPHKLAHGKGYVKRVRALPDNVRFIANSEKTRQRLLEVGIAAGRIEIKYLGVPMPEEPPPERAADGELVILYLGRLIDFKGPDLVIEAFDRAVAGGLAGRLLIAGDGPERRRCEELRQRSPNRDRIELLGVVDAATGERLRREADVFTAHNRLGPVSRQEEAFGVSVVEAMSAGLPIVSGVSGSLPEVVEDGRQGILVEPGDIEAHAAAFLRLAADPELRRRMGHSGWRRAREHFSLQRETAVLRRILGLDDAAGMGEAP